MSIPGQDDALPRLGGTTDIQQGADLIEEGYRLLDEDRPSEAAEVARRAIAAHPDDSAGHYLLAIAHNRAEEWEQAEAPIRKAIELAPTVACSYQVLGLSLNKQLRSDEAIEAYQTALSLDPADYLSLVQLSLELIYSNRWSEAVPLLEQACDADPENVALCTRLAESYNEVGRFPEADQMIARAKCLQPDWEMTVMQRVMWGIARNDIGLKRAEAEKYQEAAEAFVAALEMTPGHFDFALNLGAARRHTGQWAAAAEAYQVAIDDRPGSADAWYWLAMCLRMTNRHRDALAAIDRAIQLVNDAVSSLERAKILIEMNRKAEALDALYNAEELNPGFAEADYYIGMLCCCFGKLEAGMKLIYTLMTSDSPAAKKWGQKLKSFDPPSCSPNTVIPTRNEGETPAPPLPGVVAPDATPTLVRTPDQPQTSKLSVTSHPKQARPGLCSICGKSLGLLDRLAGRSSHKGCG